MTQTRTCVRRGLICTLLWWRLGDQWWPSSTEWMKRPTQSNKAMQHVSWQYNSGEGWKSRIPPTHQYTQKRWRHSYALPESMLALMCGVWGLLGQPVIKLFYEIDLTANLISSVVTCLIHVCMTYIHCMTYIRTLYIWACANGYRRHRESASAHVFFFGLIPSPRQRPFAKHILILSVCTHHPNRHGKNLPASSVVCICLQRF